MGCTGGSPSANGGTISATTPDLTQVLDDLAAWHVLRPLLDDGPYLPWSSGALRPAALVMVCNDIVLRSRRRIVECGSGTSTVVLARLLRQQAAGGRLVALEHDADWVARVTAMLCGEGLDDIAEVIHAPLEGEPRWYARAALTRTFESIDLLVVDGPPAFAAGDERRREPALAAFDARLSHDATVVLDDLDRPGEQAVVSRWSAQPGWTFVVEPRAGIALGTRRSVTAGATLGEPAPAERS